MTRNSPRRNSRTCTSDLLTWPEPSQPDAAAAASAPTHRSHQPSNSDQMSDVLRRVQLTEEEEQSLNNKRTCSGYKMKDITGSGIFSDNAEDTAAEADSANPKNKASIRLYQQAMNYGVSQISFNTEESVSPKKTASLPEVAKQRELSGTLHSEPDAKSQKQTTSAKTKELSGSDIFGPPPEIVPRSVAAAGFSDSRDRIDMEEYLPRNVHTSVRVSNPAGGQSNIVFGEEPVKNASKKIYDQKFAELTGNNIFKDDVAPGTVEKLRSSAKLREMAGSDIFGDGIAQNRDNILGGRQHRGGGSDIFGDGKAENRDNILGGRRHHGGGSDIFADGKAENRDRILGNRKPPGGGSSISLT